MIARGMPVIVVGSFFYRAWLEKRPGIPEVVGEGGGTGDGANDDVVLSRGDGATDDGALPRDGTV